MSASLTSGMKQTFAYLVATMLSMVTAAAHTQGVSNARDGRGNLIERGATTRTYPSVPMANSSMPPAPVEGYVVVVPRPRTVVIRPHR